MMRICFWSLLVLVAASVAGCGPSNPKTYKVTGTVKYNGTPVEGANVSFMVEKSPRASTGVTDANGKFQLTTFKSNDGALPGNNVVSITKVEKNEMKPEDMMKAMQPGSVAPPASKPLIPAVYGTAATPLPPAKVEAGKTNDFAFELKD